MNNCISNYEKGFSIASRSQTREYKMHVASELECKILLNVSSILVKEKETSGPRIPIVGV